MKPIWIINHVACEHSGYLCEFFEHHNVHFETILVDQDHSAPAQLDNAAGLVFLGAPVSVYDPLAWIADEIALIQKAFTADIPVLGICFGAQLIAKALGGEVCAATSMQIGWHEVSLSQQARVLFKDNLPEKFMAFEWHGDTFSFPTDVSPLFYGDCIHNQGFAYHNSLALQFHPEITTSMVHEWLERYAHCLEKPNRCIQSITKMLDGLEQQIAAQQRVANTLFAWWLNKVQSHDSEYLDEH
ncbi:MAG: type 1 glutamine amidotransferase [Thiobacillus sp.]|nr:type 1 glutamine amidotransferase [Thiobacillus sp.]